MATCTLVAIVAAVWFFWQRLNADPDKLLAQAYTEQRTLELRFPGATYGPMRTTRDGDNSRMSHPAALLDAEAAIAHKLKAQPENTAGLQQQGRAELLEWRYEAAIQTFRKAMLHEPESISLKIDLAAAYFERAQATDQDYREAIEFLGQVLATNPDDRVALFNHAIACEHNFLFHQAIEDWNRLLRIESDADWANEARHHLSDLQQKLERQKSSSQAPLLAPEQVVAVATDSNGSNLDARIEDYLNLAITRWLPNNISEGETSRSLTGAAIVEQVLEKQHGDPWLLDYRKGLEFEPAGARELGSAVEANLKDQVEVAQANAIKAEGYFRASGNHAGWFRAHLERVHALQRAQMGTACLSALREIDPSTVSRWPWVHGQMLLEEASCRAKASDFDGATKVAARALAISRKMNFVQLQLRSLAFAADIEISRGRAENAWAYNLQALRAFWQCSCPPIRVYAIYDNLQYVAEDFSLWNFAVLAESEAVHEIAMTQNRVGEAVARYRLASLLLILHRDEEARTQFIQAEKIFAQLSPGENQKYLLYSRLFLAELQIRKGEVDEPLQALLELRPRIEHSSNYLIPLHLYRALAGLYLKKQQHDEATLYAMKAVRIAQRGLGFIHGRAERLMWRNETDNAYRIFLEGRYLGQKDHGDSLAFWEFYRAVPLGQALSSEERPGRRDLRVPAWPLRPQTTGVFNAEFRRLAGDRAVVSFAQVPDGLIVWVITKDVSESRWVPIQRTALEAKIQRFIYLCADPDSSKMELVSLGRELYGILIHPIELFIRGKDELVLEPDGMMARMPFDALLDDQGRYLADGRTLSACLGVGFDEDAGARHILPSDKLLLVTPSGSSVPGLELPPPAGAREEADRTAQYFRTVIHIDGQAATVAAVEKALLGAQVFHFAGHSLVTSARAGLVMSQDAVDDRRSLPLLDGPLLRQLKLRGLKLVVLSSCSTDPEPTLQPRDTEDLVGTLVRAGAAEVVASHWKIDSEFTTKFMQEFYARLMSGSTVPRALQSAKSTLRRDSRYSHPYYWAAFSSVGRL